ncbi:MAG: hypothetical protein J6N95_06135 [Bacilli bacterium]|nr:hypothetical protein [Bacilli bacterium]
MSEEAKKKRVKKPKSKARKIIEWVFTGIFLALFAFLMVGQIDGMVHKKDHYGQQIRLGYATFVVQTDSMEPDYKVKSAIITFLDDADKIYERYQNKEKVDLTFMDVYQAPLNDNIPSDPTLTDRVHAPSELPIVTHRLREMHVNPGVEKGKGKYIFIVAGINTDGNLSKEGQYQAFTEKELLGRVIANSDFLGGVFGFVGSPFGLLVLLLIPAFYLIITSVIDIFKAYKEPEEATEGGASPSNNNGKELNLSEEDKKRLKEQLLEEMLNKKKGGEQ